YHDNGETYQYAVLNFGAYGATSLHTTAEDLLLWLREYHTPTVLKQESFDFMQARPLLSSGETSEYAGGLRVQYFGGHRVTFHSGVDAAFRAVVMHIDDLDYDIVGLSNTQNTVPRVSLTEIAKCLCGEKETEKPVYPARKAEETVGFYYTETPDPTAWEVIEEGQLRDMYDPMPLVWEGERLRVGRLNQYLTVAPRPAMEVEGAVTFLTKADESPLPAGTAEYAGKYTSEELATEYEVVFEDGRLYLNHFRKGNERLYPLREDTFIGGVYPCMVVKFLRDDLGAVNGLSISTARLFDVCLTKA
ncbi:MAG: hypothetical protein IJN00_05370, partial [Clostridia bacterium]|nr:hypothetical protein [Clostridia bacterium]